MILHLLGPEPEPAPAAILYDIGGGGVRSVELPGNHMGLITDPVQASVFARAFAEALRWAE